MVFSHTCLAIKTRISSGPPRPVAATYNYDSFGFLTSSTGSATNWFRYTARQFDSDTALYYYRARYYDPTTGRFLSEDPIGFVGGINRYRYVGNNSLLYTDSSGLCPSNRLDRKTALAHCVKDLFGMNLTAFTPSGKGQNGSFSGQTSTGSQITVTNDVTTFTVQDLNEIFFKQRTPPTGRSDIHGLTLSGELPHFSAHGIIRHQLALNS